MMQYSTYVLSTVLYGLFGLVGLGFFVYFTLIRMWAMIVISVLITYVATDNFFCPSRLKKAGMKTTGKWIWPPFLRIYKSRNYRNRLDEN